MKKSKVLIVSVCAVLLVVASVLGTLAWLTDKDTVVNTFTVGQVDIALDETAVTPDGKPIIGADRVKENNYHLVPGMTYTKDPTMTVKAGSEEAYVRMLVTLNCADALDTIFADEGGANLPSIFNGYDSVNWLYEGVTRSGETITYEFRYKETVKKPTTDTVLEPLFDSITVPGAFSSDDMKSISTLNITVVGHAIQAAGFANEDAAWSAFDAEINS